MLARPAKLAAAKLASICRLVGRIGRSRMHRDVSQTPSASLDVTSGRIGGIFGPRIEGDRGFGRHVVNDVHDRLK